MDGPHADVLIVGAGAAGGVAGRRLAEAGFRVICLEQGEWPDRADFPGDKPERELLAARRWSSVPGLRRNPADHPIDLSSSDVGILNYNGVGRRDGAVRRPVAEDAARRLPPALGRRGRRRLADHL